MLSRQEFFTWARNGPYAQCSTEQLYFAYEVYQICPISRDPQQISHEDCGRCGNCCRRQWRIEVSSKDIQRWVDEGRIDILESLEPEQGHVPTAASGEVSYVIPKTAGCKYLIEGEQTMCSIYDTRPEVCRNFPSVESA